MREKNYFLLTGPSKVALASVVPKAGANPAVAVNTGLLGGIIADGWHLFLAVEAIESWQDI